MQILFVGSVGMAAVTSVAHSFEVDIITQPLSVITVIIDVLYYLEMDRLLE